MTRPRTSEHRQRVAAEAARLIAEHGIRDIGMARRKAASSLGLRLADSQLPDGAEIDAALRSHQRLFRGGEQTRALQRLRLAAREAMRALAPFRPRLVGAVLDGSADAHSPVCLHVFSDESEAVIRFLDEHGIRHTVGSRRLRLDRSRDTAVALLGFALDEVAFELAVLPLDAIRQAPFERHGERPMRRAGMAELERLLQEQA